MKKIAKLLLTVVVLVIVTGVMGPATVLAGAPSSGSPTPLTSYGTIVLQTTYAPSGKSGVVGVYIFSSSGPMYVEKIILSTNPNIGNLLYAVSLAGIFFNGATVTSGLGFGICSTIVRAGQTPVTGDIISVAPSTNRVDDPTGATAVPAANELVFFVSYGTPCETETFPSYPAGLLTFEATILAPTTAQVSLCNSEVTTLTSCSVS